MTDREEGPEDIREIRPTIEKSARFLSLSGLTGILAGLIATVGALAANALLESDFSEREKIQSIGLVGAAVLVLTLSLSTLLSARMAKRNGLSVRPRVTQALVLELGTSLVAGGLFVFVLVLHRMFLAVPGCLLIFYGIALSAAAKVSREEVRFLGWIEIAIGMLAFAFPEHGLLYWALGFGIVHILYGGLMYFKYEM
jgi:predicted lysophospholipase L1 biosynthesis ABC-type transport system permease subunit